MSDTPTLLRLIHEDLKALLRAVNREDLIPREPADLGPWPVPAAPEPTPAEPVDPPPPPPGDFSFPSGIVVRGASLTSQPGRLIVRPGTAVSWSGGEAKLGKFADGRVPWRPLPLMQPEGLVQPDAVPYHVMIEPVLPREMVMRAGDALVIGVSRERRPRLVETDPDDPIYLEQVVVVECREPHEVAPLHPSFLEERRIAGATVEDFRHFLASTPFCFESRAGWAARYCHASQSWPNTGEEGYGGDFAEMTGFGLMLLCSDADPSFKLAVQTRLLMMAEDLEDFGVDYPANGGHGVGRYALWLLRRMIAPTAETRFTADSFSERQQVFRRPDGAIDWRFAPGVASTKGDGSQNEKYRTCCTANRWLGFVLADWLVPIGADFEVCEYTRGYLREHLATDLGTPNQWKIANHGPTQRLLLANRGVFGL